MELWDHLIAFLRESYEDIQGETDSASKGWCHVKYVRACATQAEPPRSWTKEGVRLLIEKTMMCAY